MKSLDIALKDLTRSFRSAFALLFMFVIPLLMTGMFYFMFGSMLAEDDGFELPLTKVVIVNLDEGSQQLQASMESMPDNMMASSLGALIVESLQGESFAELLEVSLAEDAATARQMVDRQEAGVAIILPTDFSASFTDMDGTTRIELYQDPTLTLGPAIVQSVLAQFVDNFSGVKITINTAVKQAEAGQVDYAQIGQIVDDYMAAALPQDGSVAQSLLDVRSVSAANGETEDWMIVMVGGIMGGMMIFFAFFTGASTAQSILTEEEAGTLPRLFTTPTLQASILGGKFIGVALTVLVQVTILIIVAHLIFHIEWGALPPLTLSVLGLVAIASTFGILVNSLMKDTKQSGVLFGGVLTVTGMLGMVDTFTGNPGDTSRFGNLPLLMPQGWASRSLLQTMQGATIGDILPCLALMLIGSVVFFAIGVWRFQRRYA